MDNLENKITEDMQNKTMCSVVMDGTVLASEDFVAILSKSNGDASIFYNTDALTLGMAIKIIAKEYVRCRNQLSEEEKKEMDEVLGDALVFDTKE